MASLLLCSSCKKSTVAEEAAAAAPNITQLKESIAQATGMPMETVVYAADKQAFVIEEDSYISLEDARMRFTSKGMGLRSAVNGTQHMLSYFLVDPEQIGSLTIYVDRTVPQAWIAALDQAIENWNASGSGVHMERTSYPTITTTRVTAAFMDYRTIATGALPDYYGNAGRRITINTYFNSLAESKKIFALTHELGHTIGFSHTNGTFGTMIEGTPYRDSESIMNSVCLQWTGFTDYDLMAINLTYPGLTAEPETFTEETDPATDTDAGMETEAAAATE
ncbi:M57 family metalloprotease [Paraflavisolibacter sp. H34]|uniref:M57 family metalloprotease n=1 Tax=Huijunlia imazamoxiresistens TaxID=3127457 RepID=UPI00301740EF